MTLAEYLRWRLDQEKAPKRSAEDSAELVKLLTSAALTARRCGVVPTLVDLAASPEVEAAWQNAAELYREEEALHARGIHPDHAVERYHMALHEQAFGGKG